MELKEYLRILQRWFWLLLLGLIVGGVGGYYFSQYQMPVYQASTRAMVMRPPQGGVSDYTYLSDQQLTQTYIQLLTTQPVLDAVTTELGYGVERKNITAQQIRDTQIIQVTVENEYPARTSEIANALIGQLISQNESFQSNRFSSAEASLREQVQQMESQIAGLQAVITQISSQNLKDQTAQLEAQITPLQDEVSKLEQEIVSLPTWTTENKVLIAEKQARIDQITPLLNLYQEIYSNLIVLGQPFENGGSEGLRLEQLKTQLGLYQQIYLNLLNSLESIRLARLQNTPNIVQIEPAITPTMPIRPRPFMNTILAAVVGLMLTAGIVLLIEYFDDTLKTPDDIQRALGIPVLGFIAEMQYKGKSAEEIYVSRQPRSPVSEAFRALRTNLEFASVERPIHTLLVTSTAPAEGKTTVAANLAAIISQSGKRVVLLDADMRRPHLHKLLGLSNRDGLSNLFRERISGKEFGWKIKSLSDFVVITSGSLPPNPAELLGSERMTKILEDLQSENDVIVIDSPPSLVADAQVLAAKVDAVLLVVQPGVTKSQTVRSSLESFRRAGARIVGVVLNRIPRNRSYYYGGYEYYSPYGNDKGYFVDDISDWETEYPAISSYIQGMADLPEDTDKLSQSDPR